MPSSRPRSLLALPLASAPGLSTLGGDLAWIGLFVLAEALAAFSTAALLALERHSRARVLDIAGQRGRRPWAEAHLARLGTYDLTVRLTRFLGNAALVVGAAYLVLEARLSGGAPGGAFPWGPLLGTFGIAFGATFLLNEVIVRLLAARRPSRFLVGAFPALAVLRRVTSPLRVPLKFLAWLVFRARLESAGPGARDEVRQAVEEGSRTGAFGQEEAARIVAILDLPERTVGEVLTSRGEVEMIRSDAMLREAVALAHRTGHSRFPVYGRDRDDVIGFVSVRDLLGWSGRDGEASVRVRDVMRKPFFVPDSKPVSQLLEDMRARRIHLAVVLNAYGGTAGIVTIEDLLEAIVGDIADEHDEPPLAGPATEDSVLSVEGRTPVAEVNRALAVSLPLEEEYETVGGLVLHRLGKVPHAGERLTLDDVTLTVTEADERTVRRVEVRVAERA
jgi:magnesium and cobalt transporter